MKSMQQQAQQQTQSAIVTPQQHQPAAAESLPSQLYPTFKTPNPPASVVTEMSTPANNTETTAPLVMAKSTSAASSSAASSMSSGPPNLSSFRSSLTGASLASFITDATMPFPSLSSPQAPLLSRGVGRSSAHLSLVAIDPQSSVLRPDVLNKFKLAFVKGEAKMESASSAPFERKSAFTPTSDHSSTVAGTRKRRSSRVAAKDDQDEVKEKKSKVLPLMPQQSLVTLEKQLSHGGKATPVEMELAAFALARHLVDWASAFDVEDDEDEITEVPSPVVMQQAPQVMPSEWLSSVPQFFEDMSRGESGRALDGGALDGADFQYTPNNDLADDFASSASTPSFEPQLDREDSQASGNGVTVVADDFQQPQEDQCMQSENGAGLSILDPSATGVFQVSPLLSYTTGPTHVLSPLASPKVSPSLMAHLSSPHERASMLGFSLDDLPQPQYSTHSPLLAHTTTSTGAHVSLIQHEPQMAW